MCIECLDNVSKYFDNLIRYPILDLYINDTEKFIDNYLVIDEEGIITICSRYNSETIEILKDMNSHKLINLSIHKNKKGKKKIFSFGNLELYKRAR